MKKILITGCSGYIGSHLCKLLKGKYIIHGLDIKHPRETIDKFFEASICKDDIDIVFDNNYYDTIIHLAALVRVGESEEIPSVYYETNLFGTSNVLKSIICNNFIFASTGAASVCNSAYGISKRAAEDVVKELSHRYNTNYTIFRFYNVIGSSGFPPTNPDGLFRKLIDSKDSGEFTIYGTDYNTKDGTCVRDYVHVDEICAAIETAIENPSHKIECLGHGVGYSVKEMVDIYQKVNNLKINVKSGPRRSGDAESTVLQDVSKYMKTLYAIDDLLKI